MAIFQGKAEAEKVPEAEVKKASTTGGDTSYLDEMEGQGLEGFTGDTVSIPWISIMQDRTQHVIDGVCEPGVWRNSADGEVYGKTVRVIPLAFKVLWNERDQDTGKTVANYEPGSIPVERLPPKSGRGFPKMINPETRNKIDETFLYSVSLPDYPGVGYALIQASLGSIGTFKKWNGQVRAALLPSGKHAPVNGYIWELGISEEQVSNASGQRYYRLQTVKRGDLVPEDMFLQIVAPYKQLALSASIKAPDDALGIEQIQE
jgi:hypothetical protein